MVSCLQNIHENKTNQDYNHYKKAPNIAKKYNITPSVRLEQNV